MPVRRRDAAAIAQPWAPAAPWKSRIRRLALNLRDVAPSPRTAQLKRLGRRLTQRQTALPLPAAKIGIVGAVSAMLALQELDRAQSVPYKPFLPTFDIAEDG